MKRIKIFKNVYLVLVFPTEMKSWFDIYIFPAIFTGFGCKKIVINWLWFDVGIELEVEVKNE